MSGSPTTGLNAAIYIDLTSGGTVAATAAGTAGGAAGTLTRISSKNAWTVDASRDFVEVTSFADTTKTKVPGLPNAGGDINGHMDMAGSGTLIGTRLFSATTERAILIFPDVTNYSGIYYGGKAFFSNNAAGAIDSAVDLNLHFEAGPSGAAWTGI